MKKIMNAFLISAALMFMTASCTPSVTTPPTVNSVPQYPLMAAVNQITTAFIPGTSDVYTLDLKTHGYSFTPSANGTITQLGYLFNNPSLGTADFTFSLWDAIPGSALLATTGQRTLTANPAIVYFPISPVTVLVGHTYYISREFNPTTASSGNANEYIGYLRIAPAAILPQTVGMVTISQSYFTDNADPRTATPNAMFDINYLPYIDFEIQ